MHRLPEHDDAKLDLFLDYLHGELPPSQWYAFEQALQDTPDLVDASVDLIELMVMLRDVFERNEAVREQAILNSIDGPNEGGAIEALAELARLEDTISVKAVVLDESDIRSDRNDKSHAAALSSNECLPVFSYLLGRMIRSKPAAASALAAILAIGIILYLSLAGQPDTPPSFVGNTLNEHHEPSMPSPTPATAVARLTKQRDADWEQAPLTTGALLSPGQNLTLTQGFAEITTARGAIALIEAPATIELIENDNALRLHRGKLVGICETESSKGFLVRTPHMDITDLGTRFGVDVSDAGHSEVHVLKGEVEASVPSPSRAEPKSHIVSAGQALAVDQARVMRTIELNAPRFTSTLVSDPFRPLLSGAPAIWSSQMPGNLQDTQQQSDSLQIYLEQQSVLLKEDISVNVLPGETALAAEADPGSGPRRVAAGQRVTVYIIHLDSAKAIYQADYSIQFNQPILGVICKDPHLHQSDKALGSNKTIYPDIRKARRVTSPRGIDFGVAAVQGEPDDSLRCDEDTLHLTLSQVNHVDQIRVLVKEPQP